MATVDSVAPLEEARFLETHVAYEARSDQQGRITDWFVENMTPPQGAFRVLSVGCGSGLLDLPVARHLAARGAPIDYVGVNPNDAECSEFERRFGEASLPNVRVEVARATFEEFETDARFDLVHFVHSLYYVADPAEALERARQLLAPGGKLVVFQAPLGSLNQLAVRFYDRYLGRPTLFADEVARILADWDLPCHQERVDARLEVTPLAECDSDVGLALRDFIVQVESRELPEAVQALVDHYLREITHEDGAGSYIAHPVDAFVIAR